MPDILCFSAHAARRCLERGITDQAVEDAVRLGCRIDRSDDTETYARGRLRVVLLAGGMVLTAFRRPRWSYKRHVRKRRRALRRFERECALL